MMQSHYYNPAEEQLHPQQQQQQQQQQSMTMSMMIQQEVSEMLETMSVGPSNGYFQRLTFGRTFGRTFSLFLDHWAFQLFLPLSILTMMVLIPLSIVFTADNPWIYPLVTLLFLVYSMIVGRAAMIQGVAEIYAGGSPHWLDCLQKTQRHLFPLLILTVSIGAPVLLGCEFLAYATQGFILDIERVTPRHFLFWLALVFDIVLFSAIIYVTAFLIIVVPTMVIEHADNPLTAIGRSYELAMGNRYYLFYSFAIFFFTWFFVEFIIAIVRDTWFEGTHALNLMDAFLWCLPTLFFIPLLGILETVIYMNMRVQKESLTMDVLQQELRQNLARAGMSLYHQDSQEYGQLNSNDDTNMFGGGGGGSAAASTERSFDYQAPPQSQQV